MDSQRQQELETNELHKLLVKLNRFLEAHGNKVALTIAGLAVALAGMVWLQRSEQAREAAGWRALAGATGPADLKVVAQEHAESSVGAWAKLMEAEQLLSQSQKALFLDVEAGRKDATAARKAFEELLQDTEATREVRERSQFGLGQAEETLADGNPEKALQAYRGLKERFPGSYFEEAAQKRIERLEKQSAAEFYQWFAKFERPKAKDRRPQDRGLLDELGLPGDLTLPPSPTEKKGPAEGSGPANSEGQEGSEGEPAEEMQAEGAETAPEVPSEKGEETPSGDEAGTAEPQGEPKAEGAKDEASEPGEKADAEPKSP